MRWRRARRQVALRHHPDLGGDVDVYLRRMHEVDAAFERRGEPTSGTYAGSQQDLSDLLVTPAQWPRARVLRGLRRRGRKAVTRVRARIPRRFPGARRYYDL